MKTNAFGAKAGRSQRIAACVATGLATALLCGTALTSPAVAQVRAQGTVINKVIFQGQNKIKADQLQAEVQSRSRGPYNAALIASDVERIKEVYRRAGRGEAQVTATTTQANEGRLDVTFTIVEGVKTGVVSIRFVGNQYFGDHKLRNTIETTESGMFGWLKTSDVYDPDKIAADLERIRRLYLKNGFADFRITSSNAVFDPQLRGYVITIAMEEGNQYRIGSASVDSRVRDVDPASLQRRVRTSPGDIFNAVDVEKSVEGITDETGKRGYAFTQVRPRGDRDPANRTVNIVYTVEEGPRVYVERINVRGNTRTRDYVVRREFDMGEGDAFNKAYVDRAERRLKALGYFKNVRISTEQGSAPDRVVINVDVEDQATGSFAISGGYSTSDGFLAEASVTENNFLGRGQFVKLSVSNGQRSRGFEFSFTEPFFLDRRLAAGFDVFSKQTFNSLYQRFETRTVGGTLRMAVPLTEEFSVGVRYSLYQTKISIPNTEARPYNDCTTPIAGYVYAAGVNCINNGEASIAVKEAQGKTLTSLAGLTFLYNSLDDVKNPTSGIFAEARPEVAGLGGDSKFFRVTADARYYYPISDDITGFLRVQGGHIEGFGKVTHKGVAGEYGKLRMMDHFFMGPNLVRGFAPGGIGPRDLSGDASGNALGGTTYFGGTAEAQFNLPFVPRELGLRGAVFADAGILFGYKGARKFDVNGNATFDNCGIAVTTVQPECVNLRDKRVIRSSVGASLLWASPLGPIRFDYAYALTKDKGVIINGVKTGGDRIQAFRFSGGTSF
jgi:outer membrane protein insertion porin family